MSFPTVAVIQASAPTIAVIVAALINGRGQRKIRSNQQAIHEGLRQQAATTNAPAPPPLPAPAKK